MRWTRCYLNSGGNGGGGDGKNSSSRGSGNSVNWHCAALCRVCRHAQTQTLFPSSDSVVLCQNVTIVLRYFGNAETNGFFNACMF